VCEKHKVSDIVSILHMSAFDTVCKLVEALPLQLVVFIKFCKYNACLLDKILQVNMKEATTGKL